MFIIPLLFNREHMISIGQQHNKIVTSLSNNILSMSVFTQKESSRCFLVIICILRIFDPVYIPRITVSLWRVIVLVLPFVVIL
jgi:hypothetical protein